MEVLLQLPLGAVVGVPLGGAPLQLLLLLVQPLGQSSPFLRPLLLPTAHRVLQRLFPGAELALLTYSHGTFCGWMDKLMGSCVNGKVRRRMGNAWTDR